MIAAIRIGNFEPQWYPIRPLTLINGANSPGKSHMLRSLVLARHAQETGELNADMIP